MRQILPRWPLALLAAILIAGCGQSAQSREPAVSGLPLAAGARILAQNRRCDRGVDPYCSVQIVVVGRGYASSDALLSGQRRRLDALGWTEGTGDTGLESAAESPGHKLRLLYATAGADLEGVVLGWIKRSHRIAVTLSHVMFARAPALSLMLETGSS